MVHCKACNDEMPLQLITDTDDVDGLCHYEILCSRCLMKMHQALASQEWDDSIEGTYVGRHDIGGPVYHAPVHPWDYIYV